MSSETKWTLYESNEQAWNAMLDDCAKAEKSIVLEQFIFVKDDFSQKLIDVCVERATKGVKIRFLWDAAGSFTFFGSNIAEDLRQKNIDLRFWKTLIPSYFKVPNIRSWFFRNHRRTLVVDEKIGYTGSICFKDSMKGWRDANARFEGPVVSEMQNAFERMWSRTLESRDLPPKIKSKDPEFMYVTNTPAPGKRYLYQDIVEAIRNSRKYIYITSPYFIPTRRLARVIKLAAHRGIDVRIIVPDKTDHYPALDLGARSFFQTLLESGVRIFLHQGKNGENLIHSKIVIVDGDWASIGSLNLDHVSLLYNYEANIVTTNSRFAEELASHFVHDLSNCKEVDPYAWKNRFFLEKLPEYAIRMVRKFL